MPTPSMTEAEIIAYLGRTQLPTVLVEGATDASVCRWLEAQLGPFGGSVLFCSGRSTLVSIYLKRTAFKHGKVAWLADLDMWRFLGPPAELKGIIFTTGYSIENDLYAGSEIESLLDHVEQGPFAGLIATVCRWFAFEIREAQAARTTHCGMHIKRVVDFNKMDLLAKFVTQRGFVEPDAALIDHVRAEYKLRLRGKTLIQCLLYFLSAPSRQAKYSSAAVVELCLKLYPNNPHVQRLVSEVKAALA